MALCYRLVGDPDRAFMDAYNSWGNLLDYVTRRYYYRGYRYHGFAEEDFRSSVMTEIMQATLDWDEDGGVDLPDYVKSRVTRKLYRSLRQRIKTDKIITFPDTDYDAAVASSASKVIDNIDELESLLSHVDIKMRAQLTAMRAILTRQPALGVQQAARLAGISTSSYYSLLNKLRSVI